MNLSLRNRGTFFIAAFILTVLVLQASLCAQETMEDVSIDFVDADLADVVRVLATSQNLNYIIGQDVVAKVTIKLENVSFDTALNAVVTSNGFAYKITENVLYVNTPQKLQEEERDAPRPFGLARFLDRKARGRKALHGIVRRHVTRPSRWDIRHSRHSKH